MLDVIAESFPHLVAALRRQGMNRADAAGLILAARYGSRATVWSAFECGQARRIIAAAFYRRSRMARCSVEG